jgi:hypothetical protein
MDSYKNYYVAKMTEYSNLLDAIITGTTEDPGALIRVYQQQGDGYKPTDTIVGHKVSSLTEISTLD